MSNIEGLFDCCLFSLAACSQSSFSTKFDFSPRYSCWLNTYARLRPSVMPKYVYCMARIVVKVLLIRLLVECFERTKNGEVERLCDVAGMRLQSVEDGVVLALGIV